MGFLAYRNRQPECMDAPDADEHELQRALGYIRAVNRYLGYTRQTLSHLKRFSRGWRAGQSIRIVDIGTGSCDIPIAMVQWGLTRGFDLQITSIDLHDRTLDAARRNLNRMDQAIRDRITLVRADALHLPFAEGSHDYAICSLFLHHLDDNQAIEALREMNRVAARGIVACDLLRHYRAYAWICLLTAFAGPMARHDARVSVTGAFSKQEVMRMREAAGLSYTKYHPHFAHRFALAGEKPGAPG